MKISLISTSHQENSQSKRVSNIFRKFILEINDNVDFFQIDMFDIKVPLWTSDKKENPR